MTSDASHAPAPQGSASSPAGPPAGLPQEAASSPGSSPAGPPEGFSVRDFPAGQLNERLGIEVVDFTPERVVATMPVKGNLQPYGLLHGGASAALAETVGSTAAALNSPEGTISVGTQVLANHHRSARSGTVTAVAVPLHLGRSLKTFAIEITGDDGKLVCSAQLTAMTMPKPDSA